MNCLLMRELSVKNIVRMWDTYLVSLVAALNRANVVSPGPVLISETATTSIFALQAQLTYLRSHSQAEGGDAFSEFHLYVCLAFLVRWSDQLREMDFQVRHPLCPPVPPVEARVSSGADLRAAVALHSQSSCSSSRCRPRIGQIRTRSSSSRRHSCGRGHS